MRKFRNAALAVATATTVAISGVSVASAQDDTTQGSVKGLSSSSELKDKLGFDQEVTGDQIRNWLNPKYEGDDNNPAPWAKIFVASGIAAAAASVLGLIIAPAYNFLKYNGYLG